MGLPSHTTYLTTCLNRFSQLDPEEVTLKKPLKRDIPSWINLT
jgi:hypothetical protein